MNAILRENYLLSKFEGHPMLYATDVEAPVYDIFYSNPQLNFFFLPFLCDSVHLRSLLQKPAPI